MPKDTTRVTTAQLVMVKKKLQKELAAAKEKINIRYSKILERWLRQHSPVEIGKVYELAEKSYKPRGTQRFAVYNIQPQFFEDRVIIVVGGWWLDETTNKAFKWHTYPVYGSVMNPTKFTLSGNQVNYKPEGGAR